METANKLTRVQVILGLTILVFVILAVRLFYIQVIEHDRYTEVARGMQVMKDTILPERGQIYIRDGSGTAPLVLNESVYTVFADAQEIENKDEVINKVSSVAGDKYVDPAEMLGDAENRYVVLARQLSRTQAEEIRGFDLAGVGVQATTRRVYPEGGLAGQSIGFVNLDGKGQYGIEQYLDKELTGTPGVLESVTDVRRIPLTIGQHDVRVPAENGQNIVLTIDRNIQAEVETVLAAGLKNVGATQGSVLVMDPSNGAVLAMANFPSYSPADYGRVTDASLFQNATVSDAFEPGSVTKVMTTAAAIDSGVVNQNSTFYNPGCVQIADAKICNVLRNIDGQTMSMTQVLQYSLNTGVVWELEQMGGGSINDRAKNTLYNYFHERFRFDKTTGIEQGGETEGMIYSPEHEQGGVVNYANMTFGQGFRTTMVEMLSAFGGAINGGTYYQPHLVEGTLNSENAIVAKDVEVIDGGMVRPETSTAIRGMMIDARRGNAGADRGYNVGGKSGTAQVYDASLGRYSDTRWVGTFLGFGADASGTPKYVIMVRVDDSKAGGYAGSAAAEPIFTAISNWIIDYKGISK
ncbi:stage V sporulation protein D [Alphaproteobacteria bacterium]|nr:stage V sporulation protein D [Alphaproteobacteria bacterium]